MSIFTNPPRTTKYSFKQGDVHVGVWGIQRFLNRLDYPYLIEDGDFGPSTASIVKRYQTATGTPADAIVGPATQRRMVRSCVFRAPHGPQLPKGLLEGQIQAESGRLIAAVNWQVSGGFDAGLTQIRVYGPPYEESKVAAAFDPMANVARASTALWDNYVRFRERLGPGEYTWRVAALAHNWPFAADQLSRGYKLSTTKQATWAGGARFDDGAPVQSWNDWAQFYAIGSKAHNHPGAVTRLAFGIPTR